MRHPGLLACILCSALVGLSCGCQFVTTGPSLLTLSGATPKELAAGDELSISGLGFPEGKPARVAFRGDLYRPGSRVERGVEIVARTTTNSARSLSISITDDLRAAFTGQGDDAKHTTFRGLIEVSFSPKIASAAPIVGTLPDVVLDVDAPLVSDALQRQRDAEAALALDFLGLGLRGNDLGPCCFVGSATGRTQVVGLTTGDRIVDLDGVTVRAPTDLVPSGQRRVARLSYQRGGVGPIISRELDVQGFRSGAPRELAPALGLAGFFALCVLLSRTIVGRPLQWATHWLALRLRNMQQANPGENSTLSQTLGALRAHSAGPARQLATCLELTDKDGWNVLSLLSLIAMSGLATLAALRIDWASPEMDLPLWVVLQVVSVLWAAILARLAQRSFSVLTLLKAQLVTILHQVPLLALALTVVLRTRSVRIYDIVQGQAGLSIPSYGFSSPPLLLLSALSVVALVPSVSSSEHDRPSESRLLLALGKMSQVLAGPFQLWSAALLISLLCFGGYRVPWLNESLQNSSQAWQLVGAAIWFIKATAIVLVVVGFRFVAGQLSVFESTPTMCKYGLGLALTGAMGSSLWTFTVQHYALAWMEEVTAWVLLAVTVVAAAWVTDRALQLARCHRIELLPNPWL